MGESKLLKTIGIIMIIFSGLSLLIALIGLAGGIFASAAVDEATGGMLMMLSIIILVAAVIQLIAGIMGVRSWNKPEKAQGCFIMGIVIIALSVANSALTIFAEGFQVSMLFNAILGLVIPALYTYGAMQLKKSA